VPITDCQWTSQFTESGESNHKTCSRWARRNSLRLPTYRLVTSKGKSKENTENKSIIGRIMATFA